MEASPTLFTGRLRLVPFSEQHLTAQYVGWLNDVETVQYSELRHLQHTMASCRSYWESVRRSGHHFWAAETRDGAGRHIGNLTAYVDRPNQVAEVSILIGEGQARGKGLGLEAFAAVCGWLLGEGGMRKVMAGAMASNQAMIRLMRRLGMHADGVRSRHFLLHGQEVDAIHMALFEEDLGRLSAWDAS